MTYEISYRLSIDGIDASYDQPRREPHAAENDSYDNTNHRYAHATLPRPPPEAS
jgi:hypothetical protein